MSTIDDIRFDNYIYGHAMNWTILLYQVNGISVVIPLPDADLMSFVRVLNDPVQCQELIDGNPQKLITLFAYEENVHQWLTNNTHMPNNLRNMKIFCHSDDEFYFIDWTHRHMQRFNNIIFEIISFEHLNFNLLSFGLEHIRRLQHEYRDDFGILNRLDRHYEQICQSLGNNAWQRANEENERIRLSQEAQS